MMSCLHSLVFFFFSSFSLVVLCRCDEFDEAQYGVRYADDCEVCKIVSEELTQMLTHSDKKHEVIETGYTFDDRQKEKKGKKKTKYVDSELRLLESLESVCENLLEYSVHKEREDSSRFARGTSETFQTLENLVAKGVKVDIGIPKELWHKPSAEISHLKSQCEALIEEHEDVVEAWYFQHKKKGTPLVDYLCNNEKVIEFEEDRQCLFEKPKAIKGDRGEL